MIFTVLVAQLSFRYSISLLPSDASPKFNILRTILSFRDFGSPAPAYVTNKFPLNLLQLLSNCIIIVITIIVTWFLSADESLYLSSRSIFQRLGNRQKHKNKNTAKLELSIDILCHWICIQLAGVRNVWSYISNSGHHKQRWCWCLQCCWWWWLSWWWWMVIHSSQKPRQKYQTDIDTIWVRMIVIKKKKYW